jgi:hypothetical protein
MKWPETTGYILFQTGAMMKKIHTSRKVVSAKKLNPRSADFAREFKRAAEVFTVEATKSPETARAVLIEAGIFTQRGKLSKNYR